MEKNEIRMLQRLANRFVLLARESHREAGMREDNEASAAYEHGRAAAFNKAAQDLAAVVKQLVKEDALRFGKNPDADGGMVAVENLDVNQAPTRYAEVSLTEAMQFLEYAGTTVKDLKIHQDNAITAVFSRWQPIAPHERIQLIKKADPRVVILDEGRLQDGGDPYVDFAFRAD